MGGLCSSVDPEESESPEEWIESPEHAANDTTKPGSEKQDWISGLPEEIDNAAPPAPRRAQSVITPFSQQFLPEIRAIMVEMLDRQDLLSYSLASRAFNQETIRLIWTSFTIPAYHSQQVNFEDVCRMLMRVPERGRHIKTVTIYTRPHGWDIDRTTPTDLLNIFRETLALIPEPRSLKLYCSVELRQFPPEYCDFRTALRQDSMDAIISWTESVPLESFTSIHIPLHFLIPLFNNCSTISHLSIRLPPDDYDAHDTPLLSESALPQLSTLEADIHVARHFLSRRRHISAFRVHNLSTYPSPTALTAFSRTLQNVNTVRSFHTSKMTTQMVGDIFSMMEPVASIRMVSEHEDGSPDYGPYYGDSWFKDFARVIGHIPSLETYSVRCTNFSLDEWGSGSNADNFVHFLDKYVPHSRFPTFRRIDLELGSAESKNSQRWLFERGSVNKTWMVSKVIRRRARL